MLRLKKADSFQSFIEGLGYKTGRSENTRNVVIGKLTEFGIDYKLYLKGKQNRQLISTRFLMRSTTLKENLGVVNLVDV